LGQEEEVQAAGLEEDLEGLEEDLEAAWLVETSDDGG
jgi:hypothetical protein